MKSMRISARLFVSDDSATQHDILARVDRVLNRGGGIYLDSHTAEMVPEVISDAEMNAKARLLGDTGVARKEVEALDEAMWRESLADARMKSTRTVKLGTYRFACIVCAILGIIIGIAAHRAVIDWCRYQEIIEAQEPE